MATNSTRFPWSAPVSVSGIPEGGKRLELVADEATRAQIAALAGLRSLPRLQATFEVTRHGADGMRVVGEVTASIGQSCVVTLEPIDSDVREEIDLVFAPPHETAADPNLDDALDTIDLDEPEPLEGGTVDVGALAVEFLMLGIDPYPRKPGAAFEPPAPADDSVHPFAALAALKKDPDAEK